MIIFVFVACVASFHFYTTRSGQELSSALFDIEVVAVEVGEEIGLEMYKSYSKSTNADLMNAFTACIKKMKKVSTYRHSEIVGGKNVKMYGRAVGYFTVVTFFSDGSAILNPTHKVTEISRESGERILHGPLYKSECLKRLVEAVVKNEN
ncbi:hypothetical protein ACSLBF_09625 [Pseudoalteromonas sp. T1lg65]|uniref:hypothetical protein n=1 Tax=Pseudoalteromonas sp. T1lg65 TaxID=2077101 RepID=UPI003F798AD5